MLQKYNGYFVNYSNMINRIMRMKEFGEEILLSSMVSPYRLANPSPEWWGGVACTMNVSPQQDTTELYFIPIIKMIYVTFHEMEYWYEWRFCGPPNDHFWLRVEIQIRAEKFQLYTCWSRQIDRWWTWFLLSLFMHCWCRKTDLKGCNYSLDR